jgi:CheY-like chemotaxis protein
MEKMIYRFEETPFHDLMEKRILKILLVSSTYDAFLLEEDGRIDEQIFNEYVALNLRHPPQFIQVTSLQQAWEVLEKEQIDLIINMFSAEGKGPFLISREFKKKYPDIPVVVLTPFLREIYMKISDEHVQAVDYVFSWLGNCDLLLAIIKLIEDKMNVDHDVMIAGVQTILLVENSWRFYSSYLPIIYKIIFQQSKEFMTEGLNEHQKMQRMRGRPKILLATNYEEALNYYEQFKDNMLGVISDVSYNREGKKDLQAGIRLAQHIKNDDPHMTVILQSAEAKNEKIAKGINVGFLNKNSSSLTYELRNFIKEYFSFGDFVFKNPSTAKEVIRVSDLNSLQHKLFQIPDESLKYHMQRNHLSKWLNARALFNIASFLKTLSLTDFDDIDHARTFIFDTIADFRMNKGRGIIAKFYRETFNEYLNFARIGEGSIGGKARGLAFLNSLIKRNKLFYKYENVLITIPRTVVIATDVFDEFMEKNHLYPIALSNAEDQEILDEFIKGNIPERVHKDLYSFLSVLSGPVAIRSSSLLEDSLYQPFAGIYNTYMIPKSPDINRMMEMLGDAIKSVYASVFFKESKSYMKATSNLIDEEKMAIVLQQVCGNTYEHIHYPSISGVARSINFYPIEPEKSEDGIANIAFGLGKYIVDGGLSLRFSPKYPKKILQLSTTGMALSETQKSFFALDLRPDQFKSSIDTDINLLKIDIQDVEISDSLRSIFSSYDYEDDMIRDGNLGKGERLVTFANILKHDTFPLADIISDVLKIGHAEMNNPIEIEFAVNLDSQTYGKSVFNLLQIRPIVEIYEDIHEDLSTVENDKTVIKSFKALGNGTITNVKDIVFVKPESFNPSKNPLIAGIIDKINYQFLDKGESYILIGPGRWGSSDPWLGIPVKWSQISAARVIVESGLENYRIDPSQGTHFFQNLTSFKVGYLTINPYINEGYYDLDFLNSCTPEFEDEYIKHIRFDKSLTIKLSGKKSTGVILKPGVDI